MVPQNSPGKPASHMPIPPATPCAMAVKKEPITADLETFSISLSRRSSWLRERGRIWRIALMILS
ncbi:Uncharacterised protein [Vibrio cholerae]|nr:Uncharacterised protein [Vibrio cholerae]